MTSNYSLLIVDDEVDLLEMYKDYLESEGFNVVSANSGEEALEIYKSNDLIKLVISDSHMGKMSGLDLLGHMKDLNKSAPIFYLSTGDVNKNEKELKVLGVSRLILKPFDLDELISLIKTDLSNI